MPSFEEIYAGHAEIYDALIEREDYEGNLLKALQAIRPLEGIDVVEFGAGTGRFTRMLAPMVKSIRAFDASEHMLEVARRRLTDMGLENWSLGVAQNDALPIEDASADLAIEGWSFGHQTVWNPDRWREETAKAVAEMERVLRPGGTAVIAETMGTGLDKPAPPSEGLAAFYRWLEEEQGFESTAVTTDYRFMNMAEADTLVRFFFGDDLADRVVRENMMILPEWTGLWWKMVG
jgi:ubiquinone/menaquinone biosynthesis C-methylase UbiE